jgi:hypothetical protein
MSIDPRDIEITEIKALKENGFATWLELYSHVVINLKIELQHDTVIYLESPDYSGRKMVDKAQRYFVQMGRVSFCAMEELKKINLTHHDINEVDRVFRLAILNRDFQDVSKIISKLRQLVI